MVSSESNVYSYGSSHSYFPLMGWMDKCNQTVPGEFIPHGNHRLAGAAGLSCALLTIAVSAVETWAWSFSPRWTPSYRHLCTSFSETWLSSTLAIRHRWTQNAGKFRSLIKTQSAIIAVLCSWLSSSCSSSVNFSSCRQWLHDRYVAICDPALHSSYVLRACWLLVAVPYVFSASVSLITTIKIFTSSFCGYNIISHFYCDSLLANFAVLKHMGDWAVHIDLFRVFNLVSSFW